MTGRPRPALADEPGLDRSSGAIVVEICERVVGQLLKNIGRNVERPAPLGADVERVGGAGPAEAAEIHLVDMLAGPSVGTEYARGSGREHAFVAIHQPPFERFLGRTGGYRHLDAVGQKPGLVEPNRRRIARGRSVSC